MVLCIQDKIVYSLIGDDDVKNFFYLNPDSGVIILRKPLSTTSSPRFVVSIATPGLYSLVCYYSYINY